MSCNPVLDCQLAAIQGAAAALLDQVADVYELLAIGTTSGTRPKGRERFPDDYGIVLASEPCNVLPTRVRPQEAIQGAQLRSLTDWEVSFRAGRPINERQIIKVTSMGNRVFRLTGPLTASFEILRIYGADEIR